MAKKGAKTKQSRKPAVKGYSKKKHQVTNWHDYIDADGEILVVELTWNNVSDNQAAPGLLTEETAIIDALVGDGGYDRRVRVMRISVRSGERHENAGKNKPTTTSAP